MKPFKAKCATGVPNDDLFVEEWGDGRLIVRCWKDGRGHSVVLSRKDEARLLRALTRRAARRRIKR